MDSWSSRISPLSLLGLLVVAFTSVTLAPAQSDRSSEDKSAEQVDKLFFQWSKPDSPGCSLAVIKEGHIIYKRGYGMANLDYGIPISSVSVFNIASVSKQFTAMSIALLAKQGKISLDDDIRKYLPEMPIYPKPITIGNLIYHTSGIREYSHLMQLAGTKFETATDNEVFKILARQKKLNFPTGNEYLYSNSNYFLLAQIIKRASGESLREYAGENIFRPLGMSSTNFLEDSTAVIKNRAAGYSARPNGGFAVETANSDRVGDGGLLTTIEDLALWDRNFYENRLGGGPALIKQFLSPGSLNNGERIDYAFGLELERYMGLDTFTHGGAFDGFNADMIRFPDQHFSVICLCNTSNIESGRLTRQVADIYLGDQFKLSGQTAALPSPKAIDVSESELAAVAGSYFNSDNNNFRRVYVKAGKLIYSRGASESELLPIGYRRFLMQGAPGVEISFKSPQPGTPLQMFTSVDGVIVMAHDSVKPAAYTPKQLTIFAGSYHSNEIDATYTITLSGDQLKLARKNVDGETPMVTQFADAFSAAGTGSFRFLRKPDGKVTGFLLSTGRVRNLHFLRV